MGTWIGTGTVVVQGYHDALVRAYKTQMQSTGLVQNSVGQPLFLSSRWLTFIGAEDSRMRTVFLRAEGMEYTTAATPFPDLAFGPFPCQQSVQKTAVLVLSQSLRQSVAV